MQTLNAFFKSRKAAHTDLPISKALTIRSTADIKKFSADFPKAKGSLMRVRQVVPDQIAEGQSFPKL